MATPLQERTKFRLYALVSGVLLAIILVDLALARSLGPEWVFVIGLLLFGAWLGRFYGSRLQVGAIASGESRRRATYGLALAIVASAVIVISRVLDVERTTFQVVLEVVGVGIAAFLLGLSLTVLRHLPDAGSR